MGIHCNGFYTLFILISLSSTSLAQSKELKDCQKQIKDISGVLGFLLVVETIFCCYVLFTWYKTSSIKFWRKKRNNTDPEQVEGDYPMYTDIDEENIQDQKPKPPKNGLLFGLSRATGVARRPGQQNQSTTEKKPGQKFSQQRNAKPERVENPETTAPQINEQVLEDDVGGLVYSEPYEDKVSVASELKSKNPGMNLGKISKDPPPEEQKQLVYYHVLEESVECAANAPASPLKLPPFSSNSKTREEVYYYCDSDQPDNKTAPSLKPLPFTSSKGPLEDDVYYSCVEEESASSPNKAANPKKALLPFNRNFKESSPKATRSAAQQKAYFHARENQKPELANTKAALIPKNNPMVNAHMIQEMKNRVANKKTGN